MTIANMCFRHWASLLAACFLAACGSGTDAGSPDAAPPALPELSYDIPGGPSGPADLSCLGLRTQPQPGDELVVTLPVVPFGAPPDARVPGAVVQVFPDNALAPDDSCPSSSCTELIANDQGEIEVTLPRTAWFAYRVLAIDGPDAASTFLRTVETNLSPPEPDGRPEQINTISSAVMNGLAAQTGAELVPGAGVVSGAVLDCQGRPMAGAVLRAFGADGIEIAPSALANGPQLVYFDGELPPAIDPAREHTSRDGRFAAVNLPPAGAARIELWGKPPDRDAPVMVACETVGIYSDSLSVLRMSPARADGPSTCGEAN